MSGKPNDRWLETMIKKMGSKEVVKEWQQTIGAIGGKRGHTGGFASKIACNCPIIETDHYKAQCSGKKGGSASKRSRVK